LVGKRGRTRRVVVKGEVAVIEETESLLVLAAAEDEEALLDA
jgi:hypothetical protein